MTNQDALFDDVPYVDNRFTDKALPGGYRMTCGLCGRSINYGLGFEDVEKARESFRSYHMTQHAPGRVMDVRHLTVTYTGTCSVCESPLELSLIHI